MPNVLRQNQLIALVRKGFLAAKYPEKHRAILMTDVALEAIQAGRRVAYVPKQWQLIMGVIRCLPASVFHRLNI